MDSFSMEIKGFEKLESNFKNVVSNYSDICCAVIEKKSREFKKELVKNTYDVVQFKTGKLKKGYKFKAVEFIGGAIQKEFSATDPKFHLLEKGHYLVKGGKRVGWVNGRFFLKKTVEEFGPAMAEGMQEVCDLIKKECERK